MAPQNSLVRDGGSTDSVPATNAASSSKVTAD